MIEKIRKGKGARGLSEYLLASKDHNGDLRPRADIIGGTLAGRNPRELTAEIGMLRRLRPNLQTAVGHVSLRVPEGDRLLSDTEWAAIGDRWAAEMGMDSYCTVCHGDHIHILFSRVNSDGSVVSDSHDYRRGETAVRKIEQEFGLVQVEPSHLLESEKSLTHKTAPKKGDFVTMQNGDVPARLFVQNSLDALLEQRPTATRFIHDLEALGIVVEPNIASTGKLSGFAYHFGDYRFTSASLGRGYTLSNMQKRGLSYEPDGDLEAIRAAKDRAARFCAGRRAGDDSPSAANEEGVGRIAGGDSPHDSSQSGAIGQNGAGVGPGFGYATGDHGPLDLKSGGIDRDANDDADDGQGQAVIDDRAGAAPEVHAIKAGAAGVEAGSHGVTGTKGRNEGADQQSDSPVLGGDGDQRRVVPGRRVDVAGEVPLMAWNSRFKQASAAKRRAKEQAERGPLDMERQAEYQRLRAAAHGADLTAYMRDLGMEIKRDGVKDWMVEDRYRVTKKQDHFVWCSWDQSRGGDPIAFCVEELGCSFQQALADLSGSRLIVPSHEPMKPGISSLDFPKVSIHGDLIMEYLENRGISKKTALHARGAGFLRFVDYKNIPAVAFCGLDDNGRLRSMTLRLTQPIKSWNGETEITKLDIRHSDKSYPAILRGDNQSHSLWIVEGGTDGLAVFDWYRAHQSATPDIIVSSGAGVRSFLDQPHVQEMLARATVVYVAMENEKNHETQIRTDAAHQKQIQKLTAIGCNVAVWRPPLGSKDVADAWQQRVLPEASNPLAHMRQELKVGSNAAAAAGVSAARPSSTLAP